MTGPEDDHSNTRPISVAELLARNGTIGAPPIGGRRRRRRGDTDSISVAELTGEIPVVRDQDDAPATGPSAAAVVDAPAEAEAETVEPERLEPVPEAAEPAATNGAPDHVEEVSPAAEDTGVEPEASVEEQDEYADAVADYQTHVEHRDADEDLDFFAPPRRSHFTRRRFGFGGRSGVGEDTGGRSAVGEDTDTGVGAEQMSPDPFDWSDPKADEEDAADAAVDLVEPDDDDREDLPSYLRSPDKDSELFGGQDVADDVVRRGRGLGPEDIDLEDDADVAPPGPMSAFLRGAWVVAQCVVAVAFGAGLFIAFDQLWKWNSIIALVLGVLVILGLVVGVRVVRKTEDIGSTLIAVAVGAMVTFGPLALMQAG
ncbi:hypothetical protein [Mycobacterium sp. IS-1556]|uniref:hypothetical protein n=1 Tax=Mycobacterium sp. IS-1556 TaxID=1772276 RepID=UPI0007416640|nr:hypothetical protein [Mycobacterium sp. IS-1556]KUH81963.1 hypothetical protein AU187_17425 [Mycobacterium sp. IS-1556]